jgi:hypothetical protein
MTNGYREDLTALRARKDALEEDLADLRDRLKKARAERGDRSAYAFDDHVDAIVAKPQSHREWLTNRFVVALALGLGIAGITLKAFFHRGLH